MIGLEEAGSRVMYYSADLNDDSEKMGEDETARGETRLKGMNWY